MVAANGGDEERQQRGIIRVAAMRRCVDTPSTSEVTGGYITHLNYHAPELSRTIENAAHASQWLECATARLHSLTMTVTLHGPAVQPLSGRRTTREADGRAAERGCPRPPVVSIISMGPSSPHAGLVTEEKVVKLWLPR